MDTALPYDALVTFIEAPAFTHRLPDYLDDDAYTALQWALVLHPEIGAVVPGVAAFAKCAGLAADAASVAGFG